MSWKRPFPDDRVVKDPGQLADTIREMYTRGRTFGSFTWNPPEVGANTTVDTTLTTTDSAVFTGLRAGQAVYVTPPSTLDTGLGVGGAWVATDDTLTIRLINATAAPINPASATWIVDGKLVI